MDKMREEFEAWAKMAGFKMERAPEPYWYYLPSTRIAYKAWQASRKALVIELPDMIEVWNEDEKNYSRAYLKDSVELALNQNGINYK